MPRPCRSIESEKERAERKMPNHWCPYLGVQHLWACGNGEPCPKHRWRMVCPEHESDLLERKAYRPHVASYQGMPTDAELG